MIQPIYPQQPIYPTYPPPAVYPPIYPPVYQPPYRPYYPYRPYPMPYRPSYGYGNGYGRPGWGRPGYGRGFRRMSGDGCEVQHYNGAEYVVLSSDNQEIYTDSSIHAEENANAMKTYYETSGTGLCANPQIQPSQSADI